MNDPLSGSRSLLFIALMVLLGTVSTTFSSCTPLIASFMGLEWHYSPAQVGWMVTAYTVGNTLGAIFVARTIRGWPMRHILGGGIALSLLSNLALANSPGLFLALLCNGISGVGTGVISASSAGYLVYSDKPQRNLAALTLAQNIYTALLMQGVMPTFPESHQASSMFLLMGVTMLVGLPATRLFARGETIPASFRDGPVKPLGVVLILLCVLLSFASAGVVWTFLADYAHGIGLSQEYTADVITASNIVSLLLCLLAGWMARHGLFRWSVIMQLMCALGVAALTLSHGAWGFALSTTLFVSSWTVGSVIVPTLLPAFDPVGKLSALTPAAFGLGYALGSMGGGVVGEHMGMESAFIMASVLGVASLLTLLLLKVWLRGDVEPQAQPALMPVQPQG